MAAPGSCGPNAPGRSKHTPRIHETSPTWTEQNPVEQTCVKTIPSNHPGSGPVVKKAHLQSVPEFQKLNSELDPQGPLSWSARHGQGSAL